MPKVPAAGPLDSELLRLLTPCLEGVDRSQGESKQLVNNAPRLASEWAPYNAVGWMLRAAGATAAARAKLEAGEAAASLAFTVCQRNG